MMKVINQMSELEKRQMNCDDDGVPVWEEVANYEDDDDDEVMMMSKWEKCQIVVMMRMMMM